MGLTYAIAIVNWIWIFFFFFAKFAAIFNMGKVEILDLKKKTKTLNRIKLVRYT